MNEGNGLAEALLRLPGFRVLEVSETDVKVVVTIETSATFHVVRVANRCLDQARRRVQNETLGHRGRKHDPLYRIRKVLLTGAERLDERGHDRMPLGLRAGDPNDEVLGAWLAKENVRDIYLAESWADARTLLDKTIAGCLADGVAEIRSLGKTLKRWRAEILAHHATGASNGPTEGLNLCVKRSSAAATGSAASSTTASECSFTAVASPGRRDLSRHGSGPALPTHSRRAVIACLRLAAAVLY